jgi:hypothetical protein
MQIEITTQVDEETAAAIVAAIALLLADEGPADLSAPRRSAWALAGIRESHADARPVGWDRQRVVGSNHV